MCIIFFIKIHSSMHSKYKICFHSQKVTIICLALFCILCSEKINFIKCRKDIINPIDEVPKKKHSIPFPVSLIAVFGFTMSFLTFIFGIIFTVLGALISYGVVSFDDFSSFAPMLFEMPELKLIASLIFYFTLGVGIILIGISVLQAIVSIGLLKRKNWARMVRILISAFWFSQSLTSIVIYSNSGGYFLLLFHFAIIFYLAFNEDVKKVFEGDS